MTIDKRSTDSKMDLLNTTVKALAEDMKIVRQKIFNGYDTSIKSTENKVDYIDKENHRQHAEIKVQVQKLSEKMDKLLWKLVGITFFAMLISTFVNAMDWR